MSTAGSSATREFFRIVQPFRTLLILSIVMGILGGLCVTILLTTINQLLNTADGMNQEKVITFAALCAVALGCSVMANIGTNYVGQKIIAQLRRSLGAKVLSAPIEQLERYRTHRLIPVLTHDIDTVSDLAFGLPQLIISFTVTLGCLSYLASLSLPMFAVTAVAVVLGTLAQYIARNHGMAGFETARELEDQLQKHYRGIADGAKELRINRPRRQCLYRDQLGATADAICRQQVRSVNVFLTASTFGSLLFFVVIGITLGLHAWWAQNDRAVLSGFVMTLLFMKGPLESVLSLLPLISRNRIALKRIADLTERFANPEPHLLLEGEGGAAPLAARLELRGVSYSYPSVEDKPPFTVGPLDLTLKSGEILFIVGENGCGKTTLVKLLLGLYLPHQGEIHVDGRRIEAANRDDYRQAFTTVFADYHLFDDLLPTGDSLPTAAGRYLERLELAHKVTVVDGRFTTTDLSTGQRKRLALVNAWLEDRPVMVFDEWAADQDPTFRRIFYTELLPDLKRQGKTVVVISHDDRYFDVADQILHLRTGQPVSYETSPQM